jgi:uncharacterized protein
MERYRAGEPCWVDLGTPDPAAAAEFYSGLLGWQVDDPDGEGYRLCRLDGHLVAALGPGTDPGAPYWTNNVSVDDLDAAVKAVLAAGGTLVAGPGAAGEAGHFAAGTDAEGTPLSLWQPGAHAGAQLTRAAGTWTDTELVSSAPALARAFYGNVFGWRDEQAPDAATAAWTLAGRAVATLRPEPAGWPSPRRSLWLVHFAVADLDAAVTRASLLGASAPVTLPGPGPAVLLADNQGALFGVRPLRTPPRPGAARHRRPRVPRPVPSGHQHGK